MRARTSAVSVNGIKGVNDMAREYSRGQRVAGYLKRELAILLQREVRDPRVGMVNITGLKISRDSAHATVFFTVLGSEDQQQVEESLLALNQGAGFMRSQLARDSKMRTVPHLRFVHDTSVGRGAYMEDLIERAVSEDNQRQSVR